MIIHKKPEDTYILIHFNADHNHVLNFIDYGGKGATNWDGPQPTSVLTLLLLQPGNAHARVLTPCLLPLFVLLPMPAPT